MELATLTLALPSALATEVLALALDALALPPAMATEVLALALALAGLRSYLVEALRMGIAPSCSLWPASAWSRTATSRKFMALNFTGCDLVGDPFLSLVAKPIIVDAGQRDN